MPDWSGSFSGKDTFIPDNTLTVNMPCVDGTSEMHKHIILHQGSRAGAVIDRSEFRGESEWGSGGREVVQGSEEQL